MTMKIMNSLLAASCALSLVACIKQDDAPAALAKAIPTSDQVSIKLPTTQA